MIAFDEKLNLYNDDQALQLVLDKKVLLFIGEYYLQINLGIDYLSTTELIIKTQIAQQLLETTGVTSVESVQVTKNGRTINISAIVNTIYGAMNVTNT